MAKVREGRVIKLEGNPAIRSARARSARAARPGCRDSIIPTDCARRCCAARTASSTEISLGRCAQAFNGHLTARHAKAGNDRVAYHRAPAGPDAGKIARRGSAAYGSSRCVTYEPLGDEPAREAAQDGLRARDLPVYRIDQAEVLISFGADFLETWRSPIEFARQYAEFRTPKHRRGQLTIGAGDLRRPADDHDGGQVRRMGRHHPGAEAMVALERAPRAGRAGMVSRNTGVDVDALRKLVVDYDPAAVARRPASPPSPSCGWASVRQGRERGRAGRHRRSDATYAVAILNAVTGNVGKTVVFPDGAPAACRARPLMSRPWSRRWLPGKSTCWWSRARNPLFSMPVAQKFNEAFKKGRFVIWWARFPTRPPSRASAAADPSSAGNLARHVSARRRPRARAAGDAPVFDERAARRHPDRLGPARRHQGRTCRGRTRPTRSRPNGRSSLQGSAASIRRILGQGAPRRRIFRRGRRSLRSSSTARSLKPTSERRGDLRTHAGCLSAYLSLRRPRRRQTLAAGDSRAGRSNRVG